MIHGGNAASPSSGLAPCKRCSLNFGSGRMDSNLDPTLVIILFLGATFVAALVAGLAGFAFGLVAAAVWLHILTPLQTTTLIIAFGLVVQGYAVWQLRRAIVLSRIVPMVLGAAVGV